MGPTTPTFDNLLSLATTATAVENYADMERYASAVLEIDVHSSPAWEIKGKSVIGSMSIKTPRLKEMTVYFDRAIECAGDDRDDVRRRCATLAHNTALTAFQNLFTFMTSFAPVTDENFSACMTCFGEIQVTLDWAHKTMPSVDILKSIVEIYTHIPAMGFVSATTDSDPRSIQERYIDQVRQLDPDYMPERAAQQWANEMSADRDAMLQGLKDAGSASADQILRHHQRLGR